MEYDVDFPNGVEALKGARRCRILKFSSDSPAVLLQDVEDQNSVLLLGDVRRIAPGRLPGLEAEEGVAVFCGVSIPEDDPLAAGFDLSRLILVDLSCGTGREVERPGLPVLPLNRACVSTAEH